MNRYFTLLLMVIIFSLINCAYSRSKITEKDAVEKDRYKYVYNAEFKLYHPEDYAPSYPEKKVFTFKYIDVYLYAKKFSQGNAVYLEVFGNGNPDEKKFTISKIDFEGFDVSLSERSWGIRGLFPISPEMMPGLKNVIITYSVDNIEYIVKAPVVVGKTDFPFSNYPLDLGEYSDVDYQEKPEIIEFIKVCAEKKRNVFKTMSPDMLGEKAAHPRDLHYITSNFWGKRLIYMYKKRDGRKIRLKNREKIHSGLDLRGKTGMPVFAMADGIIALAEPMYYEGNFIVIDHGMGVFSYYMHLDEIKVKVGKKVKAAGVIGTVGSTGISTASHLHVSFMIKGIQVDPLSFLELPIRD